MDDTKADILMMFVTLEGKALLGESTLQSAKGDDFMKGFKSVASYDDYSNFFEVKNFSVSIKVDPHEQGVGKMSQTPPVRPGASHPGAAPGAAAGSAAAGTGSNDEWDRWRSAKDEQLKDIKYPVKFDTFSFDRIIDASSPIFFANCANQVKFKSATLVKRVSVGGGKPGDQVSTGRPEGEGGQSVGFLRIEFTGVMLTSLSWNDGDMVTENVEMTCDYMKVRYRKQNYTGDLQPEASAEWDRITNGQPNSKPGS